MKLLKLTVALMIAGISVLACGGGKTISRIDPNETVDLSGFWNDTDSRLVAEEMISDCLSRPWLTSFLRDQGKNPTVIAGAIRNKSQEHIPVGTFLLDIEREMVNSGTVQLVASAEERGGVREERADQQVNASQETLKQMGQETGADFMLLGEINQINDQEGGEQIKFYQVDLTLVNIQTNVKSWLGQKKIKKYVGSSAYKR
jgi:uncharacterized protein (TIGR02722 family)